MMEQCTGCRCQAREVTHKGKRNVLVVLDLDHTMESAVLVSQRCSAFSVDATGRGHAGSGKGWGMIAGIFYNHLSTQFRAYVEIMTTPEMTSLLENICDSPSKSATGQGICTSLTYVRLYRIAGNFLLSWAQYPRRADTTQVLVIVG